MPVHVNCPQCSQTLVAPDELIGKLASCPGCSAQFPVTNGVNRPAAAPPPPPPGAPADRIHNQEPSPSTPSHATPPPPASYTSPAAPSVQRAPVEAYAPPTKPAARSAEAPAAATSQATMSPDATARRQVMTAGAQHQPPTASTPPAAPIGRAPVQRAAKAARFIAAESTETAIQLGQDGQLPSLVLEEGTVKGKEEESQKSSPFLLVAALCISLAASVAMLLLDPKVQQSERADKPRARDLIEQHYISQPGQILPEPYQDELRAALQAHNKGDYATERRLYRRVIQRLKAENNNELRGLTGQVRGFEPPNDKDLEELLATLLRND